MKFKLHFLIVFMGLLNFSILLAAPPVYIVDYKLLITLHPRMSSYDMVLGRFLRSDLKFNDMNEMNSINQRIADNSKEATRKVEEIQREIDRIRLEKEKVERGMAGVKEFNQNTGRFENEGSSNYKLSKIGKLNKEIKSLESRIDEIWDEVMNPLYISKTSSRKIVEQVLSEIDLMLQTYSTTHGNAVIIDSDYISSTLVPDRITSVPSVGADPLSIRLYQALLHTDLLGDLPDVYKNDPSLQQYASQMRKEISDGFDQNAAMQISKQPLYGSLSGLNGRLFLAGGKNLDITRDMLSQVFRKYSIRQDIADKILAQIK